MLLIERAIWISASDKIDRVRYVILLRESRDKVESVPNLRPSRWRSWKANIVGISFLDENWVNGVRFKEVEGGFWGCARDTGPRWCQIPRRFLLYEPNQISRGSTMNKKKISDATDERSGRHIYLYTHSMILVEKNFFSVVYIRSLLNNLNKRRKKIGKT